MKISDITCPACGASYMVAESTSVEAAPGQKKCSVCGVTLARWSEHKLKVFRLIIPSEHKYAHVPVPPVAQVFL